MSDVFKSVSIILDHVSDRLRDIDPIVLTTITFISTFSATQLWHLHCDEYGITRRIRNKFFDLIKSIPMIRKQIDQQLADVNQELTSSLAYSQQNPVFIDELPENGMVCDDLIQLANVYDEMEGPNYLEGRVSGAVFSDESNQDEIKAYSEIFKLFAWSNPLWPKLFPGVRKMESEVVRMCCNMMNGDENTCGTMSTGGSISILLACLAHRNRLLRRGHKYTEMVVPSSAHAAFFKAAEVFRIKVRKIPVDPVTFKVDLNKMRKAINSSTCMLVGSAPNFPFGSVDDIESIGKLGSEFDIPVHVDACLGGFLLPFLDTDIKFDFRVAGVTSISADTHKYGLAPKGSSVVLYRNKEYLHNQYFCEADWQGGIYASATLEGSRAGANIALCWAAMLFHGRNEYAMNARRIVETTKKIRTGLANITGIEIQGDSDICIVSWTTSPGIDVFRFHDQMKQRHWQLSGLQFPAGVHLMVTMNHTREGLAEQFIADCQDAIDHVRNCPPAKSENISEAAIYGMAQGIPDRSIVSEFAFSYLDACYSH